MNPERRMQSVEQPELSTEMEALRLALVDASLGAAADRGDAAAGSAAWEAKLAQ